MCVVLTAQLFSSDPILNPLYVFLFEITRKMPAQPEVVDARFDQCTIIADDTRQQIMTGLNQPANKKTLPTLLLYNECGLRLYDKITTEAPEYYLFAAEEEILKKHADEIVQVMHAKEGEVCPGEIVLELGAG